ncbi:hypothetical protein ACHAPU_010191 [Fusarium lateritium]
MSKDRYLSSHVHAGLVLDLDPDTPPPAAPLDLLSTVPLLFLQRQEKLRKLRRDELVRKDAQLKAKFAREVELREQQEREAEKERLQNIDRRPPPPRNKGTTPSTGEVSALIDNEISRVEKGLGLKRLQGETNAQYDKRMRVLEQRVWDFQEIEVERGYNAPLQYVEGFPTNLVNVHIHFRPVIPVLQKEMYACLQCKVKERRCSRNSNGSYSCERCGRDGDRCLVKPTEEAYDHNEESWIFAEGQRFTGLDMAVRGWMGKLAGKSKIEGIQPLPAWSEKQDPDGKVDRDYMPKRWQNFMEESAENKME